jgi:hypothetical protein
VTDPADPGCEATRAPGCGGGAELVHVVFSSACCCVGLDARLPSRRRVNSLARAVRQLERKFKTKCVPRDVWVISLQLFFSAKSELAECEEKRRDRSAHSTATLSLAALSLYERTRRRCTTRALVITRRSCQGVGRVNGLDGIP